MESSSADFDIVRNDREYIIDCRADTNVYQNINDSVILDVPGVFGFIGILYGTPMTVVEISDQV